MTDLPPLPRPHGELELKAPSGGLLPVGLFTAEQMHAFRQEGVLAERERLQAENQKLRTVMIAAAEEIHAHWEAHCDAEGYGPQNLMRRLEEGIPSEYGYTAGAFAQLKDEKRAAVLAEREACAQLCEKVSADGTMLGGEDAHALVCAAAIRARTTGGAT